MPRYAVTIKLIFDVKAREDAETMGLAAIDHLFDTFNDDGALIGHSGIVEAFGLGQKYPVKRRPLSHESLDYFAALAEEMGMDDVAEELQDSGGLQ